MRSRDTQSWGEGAWEDKIKRQDETGVIFGKGSSKSEINKQTEYFMERFDSKLSKYFGKGGSILDVGVGPMARYSLEFASRGYRVTGLDISPTTLKYAKGCVDRVGVKNIALVKGDMMSFVNPKKYDSIFCIGTFYHIPAPFSLLVLRNFNRMLKNNRYALIGFYIRRERKLSEIAFEFFYQCVFKVTRNLFGSRLITYSGYTEDELQDMLKLTGFKLEKKIDYDKFRLNDLWIIKKIKDVRQL